MYEGNFRANHFLAQYSPFAAVNEQPWKHLWYLFLLSLVDLPFTVLFSAHILSLFFTNYVYRLSCPRNHGCTMCNRWHDSTRLFLIVVDRLPVWQFIYARPFLIQAPHTCFFLTKYRSFDTSEKTYILQTYPQLSFFYKCFNWSFT